jgi:protein-tyrosine phosphatase
LRARGIALPEVHRIPRDVTEDDIQSAMLTIALKELEHRPIVHERFAAVSDRVEYWHVHDVEDAPPSEAIPLIEKNVHALITRLTRG